MKRKLDNLCSLEINICSVGKEDTEKCVKQEEVESKNELKKSKLKHKIKNKKNTQLLRPFLALKYLEKEDKEKQKKKLVQLLIFL